MIVMLSCSTCWVVSDVTMMWGGEKKTPLLHMRKCVHSVLVFGPDAERPRPGLPASCPLTLSDPVSCSDSSYSANMWGVGGGRLKFGNLGPIYCRIKKKKNKDKEAKREAAQSGLNRTPCPTSCSAHHYISWDSFLSFFSFLLSFLASSEWKKCKQMCFGQKWGRKVRVSGEGLDLWSRQ